MSSSQTEEKQATKQIALSGFLSSITEYKKLIVTIDEQTFNKINDIAKDFEGKTPIYKSATGKFYLQLSLNKFEKVKVESKYLKMERKGIEFTANINQYEFEDRESGDTIKGWNCILHKIKRVINLPIVVEPKPIKKAISQIEERTALEARLLELSRKESDDYIDETI